MTQNPAAGPSERRCLCAGTLHPVDAVDAAQRRRVPLRALLHIAETARRAHLARPEAERDAERNCNSWWEDTIPGEVHVGGEPVDVLLGVAAEYDEIVEGLIRCVERGGQG